MHRDVHGDFLSDVCVCVMQVVGGVLLKVPVAAAVRCGDRVVSARAISRESVDDMCVRCACFVLCECER